MTRKLAWALLGMVTVAGALWCAAALHFTGPRPSLLADALAAAFVLAALGVLAWCGPSAGRSSLLSPVRPRGSLVGPHRTAW